MPMTPHEGEGKGPGFLIMVLVIACLFAGMVTAATAFGYVGPLTGVLVVLGIVTAAGVVLATQWA